MSTTYLETFPWWIALPAAFFMVVGRAIHQGKVSR